MEPTWMIRFCVGGVNVAIRFFFFFFFSGVWFGLFFFFVWGVCVAGGDLRDVFLHVFNGIFLGIR